MSDIISNPYVENDMTDKFVCVIYFRERNEIEVKKNGMNPFEMWKIMKYNAFDESVVPAIHNRLIFNNKNRKFIIYDAVHYMVSLTNEGRQWGESRCTIGRHKHLTIQRIISKNKMAE